MLKGFVLVSVVLMSDFAHAAPYCGSLDRVTIALRLITALYPETSGREFDLSFSAGLGDPNVFDTTAANLGVTLKKSSDSKRIGAPSPSSSPRDNDIELPTYLEFSFVDFESDTTRIVCHPVNFRNNTENRSRKEVLALINSHPEWDDAKNIAIAEQHGMKLGPNKRIAVVRSLPLKSLRSIYGPLIVTKATFNLYVGEKCTGCFFTDMHWRIELREPRTPTTMTILVDPFDGRIDRIVFGGSR